MPDTTFLGMSTTTQNNVGVGLTSLGHLMTGLSDASQYRSSAAANARNAKTLRKMAIAAGQRGSAEEERVRRAGRDSLGEMAAVAAQTGNLNGGTFEGVYDQSATAVELDALNARYEGVAQRLDFEGQADEADAQARAARRAARRSTLGGILGAGAAFLGGFFGSDRRVKRAIVRIGEAFGLPLYQFHYLWDSDDAPLRTGWMADEVLAVYPDRVHVDSFGIMSVDYSGTGIV